MSLGRKGIVIIQDGVGDRPISSLGYLTPLQSAQTPNMDKLAAKGICGLMDPIAPGIRGGTDTGHFALFGLNPYTHYTGRGPIEAAGLDLKLRDGDVSLRVNFGTVDEDMVVVDRRAGRINQGTKELAASLDGMTVSDPDGDVTVLFKAATEHRAVLVIRGEDLSDQVTDSDPLAGNEGQSIMQVQPLTNDERAIRTARILNAVSVQAYNILRKHPVNIERLNQGRLPANAILMRGAGRVPYIEPISEKFKISVSCVAAETTILGVAKLAGYKTISVPSMTGNIKTDVIAKANLALEAIKTDDLVFLHVKGPDLCGHDNNPMGKIKIIERVDEMVGHILGNVDENTYVALAADHSTPCEVRDHSADPVPIAIYGPGIRVDRVTEYNEITCAEGALSRITGMEFFMTIADFLGVTNKFGS